MCRHRTDLGPSERGGTPAREPLSLRLYPDSVLREPCGPVERFDAWLSDVFEEMLGLMRTHDGIGLAGPQAGLTQRLFVAQMEGQTLRLANPVILVRSGRDRMAEGCLSLPGLHVEIERNFQVEVQAYDARGTKQKHRVQGLWARVMQHEIDHLDGVLICDHQDSPAIREEGLSRL